MSTVLITLGCSFTKGDGCWDKSILKDKFKNKPITELTESEINEYYTMNQEYQLKNSWPSKLQELLKYDELYNLGESGSSISHSIKVLMESFWYKDFSDSNVLLIHLLPEPSRISFYVNSKVSSFMYDHPLWRKYFEETNGDETNYTLEAYFYMKVLKELCNSRGWNFLFFSLRPNEFMKMKKYKDKDILKENFMNIPMPLFSDENQSEICFHPNEEGYLEIANKVFNYITENKKEIKLGNAINFKKEKIDRYQY